MDNNRWEPICGDCWPLAEPGQYFPETTGYHACACCGVETLTVNVHPDTVRAAKAVRAENDLAAQL